MEANQAAPEGALFSLFDTTLYFKNSINETKIHSIPLTRVTKQEIQFLAFLHGHDAIRSAEVKFVGKDVVPLERSVEAGIISYCKSDRDDLKRIARKYDKIVDPGIGKTRVEACFNVRLDGFENVIEEVNAVEMAGAAAERAEQEAVAAAAAAGAARAQELKPPPEEVPEQVADPALERAMAAQPAIGERFGRNVVA